MKTTLFTTALVLAATNINAQTSAEIQQVLENAVIPTELSDDAVQNLVTGFCGDKNQASLNTLILGVAQQRPQLLDGALKTIATGCPAMAETVAFTVNTYTPEYGLSTFATLSSYLQQAGATGALAALNSTNPTLLAQLNQGLDVETAAGPSEMNFDSVLESLDIPVENPAQLSTN